MNSPLPIGVPSRRVPVTSSASDGLEHRVRSCVREVWCALGRKLNGVIPFVEVRNLVFSFWIIHPYFAPCELI